MTGTENIITTISGRETHRNGWSNIGVHVFTGRGLEPLATAAKDEAIEGLTFVKGKTHSVSSVEGMAGDLVGSWNTREIIVPDGTPLMVRWVRQPKGGKEEHGIGMFVARRGYPFIQAQWPTIDNPRASRSWVGLSGRCRNVTVGELRSRGILVPKIVEAVMEDEATYLPDIKTLEPGYIAVPEIISRELVVEGKVKRVTTSRRRRKLEV